MHGKLFAFAMVLSAAWTAVAAPSLVEGRWLGFRISSFPASMSCMTWAGKNIYYTAGDDASAKENKLYKFRATPGYEGTNVVTQVLISTVALENVYDVEGIAYDPGSGCVWCANECANTSYGATVNEIAEFDVTTGKRTGRRAELPAWFNSASRVNYSIESLTISMDGLSMWTANEEALTCDGARSTPTAGTICRLVKFTRPTIYDDWVCTSMYAYLTEHWVEGSGFASNRRGISDLAALPDGGLLVLERDLSGSCDWEADFYYSIFYVSPAALAAATDVISNTSLKANTAYTKVTKTSVINNHAPATWINVEGMCLGQMREIAANPTLWLCTDAGDGTTSKKLVCNSLKGYFLRDYSIDTPAYGTSSIVGGPYRCTNGTPVKVELTGLYGLTRPAYTNDGETLYSASWYISTNEHGRTEVKWYGANNGSASFRVWYDTRLSWDVTQWTPAVSDIYDHDTFEEYDGGTDLAAGAVAKWSGEGAVTNLTYSPATPPGYALARATHTRVLKAEDAERTVDGIVSANSKMEMMMSVTIPRLELSSLKNGEHLAVAVNNDGCFYLWALDPSTSTCKWVRLSDKTYADGAWVRVGIELDYTTNPNGCAFCRVRLDGSICLTANGVRAPDDLSAIGGWHYLARNRTNGGVVAASMIQAMDTQLDDFAFEKESAQFEHVGATSVDGIAFSWFDNLGLPRDPKAKPPVNTKYATLKEIAVSGVDPYRDEELAITDIGFDEAGRPVLRFNAYKGDQPTTGFTVIESTSPEGLFQATEAKSATGTVSGDAATWSSEWTGTSTSGGSLFYRLKAN